MARRNLPSLLVALGLLAALFLSGCSSMHIPEKGANGELEELESDPMVTAVPRGGTEDGTRKSLRYVDKFDDTFNNSTTEIVRGIKVTGDPLEVQQNFVSDAKANGWREDCAYAGPDFSGSESTSIITSYRLFKDSTNEKRKASGDRRYMIVRAYDDSLLIEFSFSWLKGECYDQP